MTASAAVNVEHAGNGVWMHGVVATMQDRDLAGIAGMSGTPVRAVAAGGIAAVVSDVPLAEFGEQVLRRNLENLQWLERVARTHHAVVAELARTGAVVPARLATIHHDDDRVTSVLKQRYDELAAALDRLAGREEWGVKAYAVPGVPTPGESGEEQTGAAYLRRRKAQLAERQQGQQAAADAARAVHAALADYAVAACRHPPQDRRLSGAATAMTLNGAYLIDHAEQPGFAALVDALGRRNPAIRLELTGPWPAYSFVDEAPLRVPGSEEAV